MYGVCNRASFERLAFMIIIRCIFFVGKVVLSYLNNKYIYISAVLYKERFRD